MTLESFVSFLLVPAGCIGWVGWIRFRLKRPPISRTENFHFGPDFLMAAFAVVAAALVSWSFGDDGDTTRTRYALNVALSSGLIGMTGYVGSLVLSRKTPTPLTGLEVAFSNAATVLVLILVVVLIGDPLAGSQATSAVLFLRVHRVSTIPRPPGPKPSVAFGSPNE